MALFDSLAVDGAVRPKEFATMVQMEAVAVLKTMVVPMLPSIVPLSRSEDDPPAVLMKRMTPILNRSIDRLDTSHLKKFLEMLFRLMDSNKNGKIEKSEFEAFFGVAFGAAADPQAASDLLFKMVDKNGNGKLSLDEAQELIDAVIEMGCTIVGGGIDMVEMAVTGPDTTAVITQTIKETIGDAPEISREQVVAGMDGVQDALVEKVTQFFEEVKNAPGMQAKVVGQVRLMRESIAKFESNVGAQFYMKAMEFSQGGVDEATFVGQVVPLLRESQKAQMEEFEADPMKAIKEQFAGMSAMNDSSPYFEATEQMILAQMEQYHVGTVIADAVKKGSERGTEYLPEIVREVFRFLDLDDSGTISSQEIALLKALLDAMLHLGERAIHNITEGEMKPVDVDMVANARTLVLTIFDVVDRDHSGKLDLVEMVQFGQKVVAFVLGILNKVYIHIGIECIFDELIKGFVEQCWKQKGLDEVSKDEIMMGLMMAPMALQMMTQ